MNYVAYLRLETPYFSILVDIIVHRPSFEEIVIFFFKSHVFTLLSPLLQAQHFALSMSIYVIQDLTSIEAIAAFKNINVLLNPECAFIRYSLFKRLRDICSHVLE